ncbi:MAG: orotidine-5'-phosphate decarboxylase, partial [Candidatus Omnitrophica bacterium]|nr:orotidine-5'-phosphate decarboxylase [Candidatus Omnitrophota bacterium]
GAMKKDVESQVLSLARLAKKAGLNGIVASAKELTSLREAMGKDFLIVTPGVRPAWAKTDDQRRVATPREAIEKGADYIVVGRPIIKADDPKEAAEKILKEIT